MVQCSNAQNAPVEALEGDMQDINFPVARPGSIARGLGCSAATVRSAIRALREAGEIKPRDTITGQTELTIAETIAVVRHLRGKRR